MVEAKGGPEPATDRDEDAVVGRISVDSRMNEYANLLPPDWVENFVEQLTAFPMYGELGNRLLFRWRGVARVADFPKVMMDIFGRFAEGVLAAHPIKDRTQPIASHFAEAFRAKAPRLARHAHFHVALRHAEESTQSKLRSVLVAGESVALETVRPEKLWQEFIANGDFCFRVWSSMQAACVAAYNAYDGFLRECAPGPGEIKDRLERKYGKTLSQQVFQSRDIQIARKTRHALTHNQALLTDELSRMPHGLFVEGGLISIYPVDLRRFFHAMGQAAIELVQSGV